MAWSAMMFKLLEGTRWEDLNELPPIADAEAIYAALRKIIPEQKHHLGQTTYEDETCYVEFNYESKGIVDLISIRSNVGQNATVIMKMVCDALKLTMIDYQSGEIFNFDEDAQANIDQYRSYVRRIIAQ